MTPRQRRDACGGADWLDSFVWMTLERKCYLPLSWDSEGGGISHWT